MPPKGKGKHATHKTARKGYAQPGDVLQISVLAGREREDEALVLLKRIHRLVRPLMKKHGFILPKLSEFFPDDPRLLGVNCNRGERICIRLRHHHPPNAFMELEDSLIPTMLHELTHNIVSAHDDKFNALLDSYQDEYDALRRGGYDGTGLAALDDGEGNKVGKGAGGLGLLPLDVKRRQALARLEERDRKSRLMGKGGRLGGEAVQGKSVKEVLAEAAERRAKGRKGCGGNDHATNGKLPAAVQLEVDKAVRDGKVEVIDLTIDSDDEEEYAIDSKGTRSRDGSAPEDEREVKKVKPELFLSESDEDDVKPFQQPQASTSNLAKPKAPPKLKSIVHPPPSAAVKRPAVDKKPPPPAPAALAPSTWSCEICTFQNPLLYLACSICQTVRPAKTLAQRSQAVDEKAQEEREKRQKREREEEGWKCSNCKTKTSHDFWCCSRCGEVKKDSSRAVSNSWHQ